MPYDSLGIWHDPGNGQFAPRGFSTLKALAMLLAKGMGTRDRIKGSGSGKARVADNMLSRAGIKAGDIIDVSYKNDDYASVQITSKSGKKRKYDVQWARFDDAWVPGDEVPVDEPVKGGDATLLEPGTKWMSDYTDVTPFLPDEPELYESLPTYEPVPVAGWTVDESRSGDDRMFVNLLGEDGSPVATLDYELFVDDPVMAAKERQKVEYVLDRMVAERATVAKFNQMRLDQPVESHQRKVIVAGAKDPSLTLDERTDIAQLEDKYARAVTKQRLARAMDPLHGLPVVVTDDAVVFPNEFGVVRGGGKIRFAGGPSHYAMRENAFMGARFNYGIMEDTPDNWRKAVLFAGLAGDAAGNTSALKALWDATTVQGDTVMFGDASMPFDEALRRFNGTRTSKLNSGLGAALLFDNGVSQTALPKGLFKVGASDEHKANFPPDFKGKWFPFVDYKPQSVVKRLFPARDELPERFGLRVSTMSTEGATMDGRGNFRQVARGLVPTKIEAFKDDYSTYDDIMVVTFTNPDGRSVTDSIRLPELRQLVDRPDATPQEALAALQEMWKAYGGDEVRVMLPMNAKDNTRLLFRRKFDFVDSLEKRRMEEVEASQVRRELPKKLGIAVMPDGDGGFVIDNTSGLAAGKRVRLHVDKDGNLYRQRYTAQKYVEDVGYTGGGWTDMKRPLLKNATDADIQLFAYAGMLGVTPADAKRMTDTEGATFGPDGMKIGSNTFESMSAYTEWRKEQIATTGAKKEVESLGGLSADSFTSDNFREVADKALRVGHDNPKSSVKALKINGGGKWTSQGADLLAQRKWLMTFPVGDTVVAALGADLAGLPDDPLALVDVPEWAQRMSDDWPRAAIVLNEDGSMRVPAYVLAAFSTQKVLDALSYSRNSHRNSIIRETAGAIKASQAALEVSQELQNLGVPKDVDYRDLPRVAMQMAREKINLQPGDGGDKFDQDLAAGLLDLQNGAWAQSSQSHFSTAQMIAVAELAGQSPSDYPEWNQWRTARASGNGYALGFSEGEMMLARLTALSTYTLTQNVLEEKGFGNDDILFLMRGSGEGALVAARDLDQTVRVATNPLSSHATTKGSANNFARGQALAGVRVPRSRVFSFADTGPGTYREYEVVVIGDPNGLVARAMPPSKVENASTLKAHVSKHIDPDGLLMANDFVGEPAFNMKLARFGMAPAAVPDGAVDQATGVAGLSPLTAERFGEDLSLDIMPLLSRKSRGDWDGEAYATMWDDPSWAGDGPTGHAWVSSRTDELVDDIARPNASAAATYLRSLPPEERFSALNHLLDLAEQHDFAAETGLLTGSPPTKFVVPSVAARVMNKRIRERYGTILFHILFDAEPFNGAKVSRPLNGKSMFYTGGSLNPDGSKSLGRFGVVDVTTTDEQLDALGMARRTLGPRPSANQIPTAGNASPELTTLNSALRRMTQHGAPFGARRFTADDVLLFSGVASAGASDEWKEKVAPLIEEALRPWNEWFDQKDEVDRVFRQALAGTSPDSPLARLDAAGAELSSLGRPPKVEASDLGSAPIVTHAYQNLLANAVNASADRAEGITTFDDYIGYLKTQLPETSDWAYFNENDRRQILNLLNEGTVHDRLEQHFAVLRDFFDRRAAARAEQQAAVDELMAGDPATAVSAARRNLLDVGPRPEVSDRVEMATQLSKTGTAPAVIDSVIGAMGDLGRDDAEVGWDDMASPTDVLDYLRGRAAAETGDTSFVDDPAFKSWVGNQLLAQQNWSVRRRTAQAKLDRALAAANGGRADDTTVAERPEPVDTASFVEAMGADEVMSTIASNAAENLGIPEREVWERTQTLVDRLVKSGVIASHPHPQYALGQAVSEFAGSSFGSSVGQSVELGKHMDRLRQEALDYQIAWRRWILKNAPDKGEARRRVEQVDRMRDVLKVSNAGPGSVFDDSVYPIIEQAIADAEALVPEGAAPMMAG